MMLRRQGYISKDYMSAENSQTRFFFFFFFFSNFDKERFMQVFNIVVFNCWDLA